MRQGPRRDDRSCELFEEAGGLGTSNDRVPSGKRPEACSASKPASLQGRSTSNDGETAPGSRRRRRDANWHEPRAIDGVAADDLDAAALRAVVSGPAGRMVRLTLEDGETRTLERRDFY